MAQAEVNVAALYAALDAERRERGLSWRRLARDVDVSPSTLSRMANGRRPDVDAFAALVNWLGMPAERFFRSHGATPAEQPDLMAQLAPLLRARQDLSSHDVEMLEQVIRATVRRARAERAAG